MSSVHPRSCHISNDAIYLVYHLHLAELLSICRCGFSAVLYSDGPRSVWLQDGNSSGLRHDMTSRCRVKGHPPLIKNIPFTLSEHQNVLSFYKDNSSESVEVPYAMF